MISSRWIHSSNGCLPATSRVLKENFSSPPVAAVKVIQVTHSPVTRKQIARAVGRVSSGSVSEKRKTRAVPWQVPEHEQVGNCRVTLPPTKYGEPKAVVNFVGGAFVGAAPQFTYSYFLDLLASAEYIVIATPYALTFDHMAAARSVHSDLQECLSIISGPGWKERWGFAQELDLTQLPLFNVGHSNGALLVVLMGCVCNEGRLPKGSVVISFNNKSASDAIPSLDQVGPALSRVVPVIEATPLGSMAKNLAGEAERLLRSLPVSSILPPGSPITEGVAAFSPMVEQIGPVIAQIASGTSEFTPRPSENRALIAASYSVPNTLLVKFRTDELDETQVLQDLLQTAAGQSGGRVSVAELTGTHLSPVAQDVRWEVGNVYTPMDAIGQLIRASALADIREAAKAVVRWLDDVSFK